jgi:membrane-associated phospholipid phosphatase
MPIRARWPLAGAGACFALLACVWLAAFHVGAIRNADQSTYQGFVDLHRHSAVRLITGFFVSLSSQNPYVYLAPAVGLIALLRGSRRLAVAAGVILLGANVTTELLKHLVAHLRPGYLLGRASPPPAASWPSGHSTAAMALALCCVLVAPARLRPAVAALGGPFAVAVGYSVLTAGMHYPSDVLGGFLVAAAWALLTVAALAAAQRRPTLTTRPGRTLLRTALRPPGAAVVAAILLVAIVVVVQPHQVVAYVGAHEELVAMATAIATLGLALSTGVMLSVLRSERQRSDGVG